MGNNRVGRDLVAWLRQQGEEIVALIMHSPENRTYGDEIIEAAKVSPDRILDGSRLDDPETTEAIRDQNPEIGISAFFGHIVPKEILDLFPLGCVNIHPSYLPHNRGKYANVWSIVDRTPAGASLHYMDEGVDTGPIIAQQEVPIEPIDTGKTLHEKLEQACVELFQENWPAVREGNAASRPQNLDAGSSHRERDVETIDEIDLDREYLARDLIDVLRARTFPPYRGAWFREGGKQVYVQVELSGEAEWGIDR